MLLALLSLLLSTPTKGMMGAMMGAPATCRNTMGEAIMNPTLSSPTNPMDSMRLLHSGHTHPTPAPPTAPPTTPLAVATCASWTSFTPHFSAEEVGSFTMFDTVLPLNHNGTGDNAAGTPTRVQVNADGTTTTYVNPLLTNSSGGHSGIRTMGHLHSGSSCATTSGPGPHWMNADGDEVHSMSYATTGGFANAMTCSNFSAYGAGSVVFHATDQHVNETKLDNVTGDAVFAVGDKILCCELVWFCGANVDCDSIFAGGGSSPTPAAPTSGGEGLRDGCGGALLLVTLLLAATTI